MAIKKVWVTEDCTACELCVELCPEVFSLEDDIAVVNKDANLNIYEEKIKEAAEECPVEAIKLEEE